MRIQPCEHDFYDRERKLEMFKPNRVMNIIDGLRAVDALLLVVWDSQRVNPRIYLKPWCGFYRASVSIGTAECVLEEIKSGRKRRPIVIPLTRRMRHAAVETEFVGGREHV